MKIRYIELQPLKQIKEFETRLEFNKFYAQRIKEIIDYTFPNQINFYDYYKYTIIRLNKNGMPRKLPNPTWLHSKKARKNQRKNWLAYCERRKKETAKKRLNRQIADIDFKIEKLKKEKEELKKEKEEIWGDERI